jgi:hypothetical protein
MDIIMSDTQVDIHHLDIQKLYGYKDVDIQLGYQIQGRISRLVLTK